MTDTKFMTVKVEVDTSGIDDGIKIFSSEAGAIRAEVGGIKSVVETGIGELKNAIDTIKSDVGTIITVFSARVKNCVADVLESMDSVVNAVNDIKKEVERNPVAESLSMGADTVGIAGGIKELISGLGKGKGLPQKRSPYTNDRGQLLLPGPVASDGSGKSGGNDSAVSGLVSGAFAGGGDFSSILPDGEMLQSLGELTAKLKESAAAWLTQTGAKIADKAVDLQIMALYALDYVKAFGAMIAQIAASTAAWIANTAVKVANTAAQWAQIAATTAWNALCAVATTVTTAFGAAMAFLTSPIGLVVVAVAALIAIVVLLVKNWDTVKAAALSVWEAIKSAFGSAWKWFKETVLDPLVGGFKGMINGIIGFLNGLIAGIVKGINGVIGLLNKLNFDIPDWVPLIGGQTFGFNIAPLTAPKIPLLAQGAVLPANKPFLAVVGDQKHGTNIEAPLATIQQALADVLAQQGNDIHIRFTGDLAQSSSMLHGADMLCPMKDAALSARGSSK